MPLSLRKPLLPANFILYHLLGPILTKSNMVCCCSDFGYLQWRSLKWCRRKKASFACLCRIAAGRLSVLKWNSRSIYRWKCVNAISSSFRLKTVKQVALDNCRCGEIVTVYSIYSDSPIKKLLSFSASDARLSVQAQWKNDTKKNFYALAEEAIVHVKPQSRWVQLIIIRTLQLQKTCIKEMTFMVPSPFRKIHSS